MTRADYHALLIANSTFPYDQPNLCGLEGPRNDSAVLRGALCDDAVGLFPDGNVRLVTERTMAEVLHETDDFLRDATRHDTLLIYYSGHGMLDHTGELYLCTRDTRSQRLRSTAVKASHLRSMMDDSPAKAMIVFLDCCYSGKFKSGGGVSTEALSGRGRFVVTSSRGTELAQDADARNHASVFTHYVAEGLRHGAIDHDGDGSISVSELYDYVHGELVGTGRPAPQKRFEGEGDIAIARRRTPPPPPPPRTDRPPTGPGAPHPGRTPRQQWTAVKGAAKEFLGSLADGPSVRTLRRRWRSVGRFWVWLLSIAAVAWLGMWMYLIYAETQERHIIDRLEAAGESVEGTIESTTGGGGYGQYRVVFDSGDAPRTETLAAGTNTPDREPGQAVTIRVDPHDPTHIAVGGDTNYAVTPRIVIVNLVIAVPFLAAAGVIVTLVRGRRRRSRAQ